MIVRKVAAGRGWGWVQEGFGLFLRNPLLWVVMSLVLMGTMYVLSLIPYLGVPLIYLLSPIPVAGMMAGCRDLELGRELSINHLLSGLRDGASHLVTLGGVFVIAQIVIGAVVSNMAGSDWQQLMNSGAALDPKSISPDLAGRLSGAMVVGTMLMVPVALMLWFSPPLVILEGLPAGRAMLLSLQACLLNVMPALLYGLIMMLLLTAVFLSLGFGVFIWLPVAVASTYASYKDVFFAEQPPPVAEEEQREE